MVSGFLTLRVFSTYFSHPLLSLTSLSSACAVQGGAGPGAPAEGQAELQEALLPGRALWDLAATCSDSFACNASYLVVMASIELRN